MLQSSDESKLDEQDKTALKIYEYKLHEILAVQFIGLCFIRKAKEHMELSRKIQTEL